MSNDKRVIYKYPLEEGGLTVISGWFTGAMYVGEQDGKLFIWMENSLTRTEAYSGKQVKRNEDEKVDVEIYVIGTGWSYYSNKTGKYIGTVQMENGLVWHIFVSSKKGWVQI